LKNPGPFPLVVPRQVSWHPAPGPRPALWYYRRNVWLGRVVWNWLLITLSKVSPWFRLKNTLLRLVGMKIGKGVALGYNMQPDVLFPQDIVLGDDVTVGYNTTLLAHGYLRDGFERGRVVVEQDAVVGAACTVLAGVTIGRGAVVAAGSLVNRDVPAGEFWGGVPAKRLTRRERPPEASA
jgi:acetyltransferase-like isoleucine patch superfamily enzyme